TADVTATAGADYTATAGILTFAAGVTTQAITVPVLGDVIDETNETFTVNLSAATGATIADGQGVGTILDNDPVPTLAVNHVTVTEGNTGTTNAVFTVTLTGATALPVSVSFATADVTATAGSDYTGRSGSLTFQPGTTAQQITVAVLGDVVNEPNETFNVNLSAPVNAAIGDGQGVGTILNDDASNQAPVLNPIGNKTVNEGQPLTFTATATDPDAGQTLTFSLQGTVPAGAAIDPATGAFTWTPTEAQGPSAPQVTVRVTDNGTPALFDDETITITVNEVNQAPVLLPIGPRATHVDSNLTFTAVAAAAGLPAHPLTVTLQGAVPAGATINPTTGLFSWTPTAAQGEGDFPITVRVTDNGAPNLFDEEIVDVAVRGVNLALNTVVTSDIHVPGERDLYFVTLA